MIGRLVGLILLMMGLFILFQNSSRGLKWGIGLTAVGVLFLMNKIHKKED